MDEIWKVHKSGYRVSNLGRIKGKYKEFLKGTLNFYGYLVVCLNNKGIICAVHRVICETFLGDIPEGYTVNHKDGIKINNKLENLEIVPHRENVIHSYRMGLKKGARGEKAANAKIDTETAKKIFSLIKSGKRNIEIAKELNLTHKYISKFRCGTTWSHLGNLKQ